MSIIIVWHQFWVHWPAIKNVSCASRAGCCWGWNRESKFQNELSTKLLVGISENLTKTKIPLYWIAPMLHIHYNFEWFWYQSNKLTITHLPHFQKDLSELCSNFHQRMKMTWCWYNSLCIKIVWLELFCFPGTTEAEQQGIITKDFTLHNKIQQQIVWK